MRSIPIILISVAALVFVAWMAVVGLSAGRLTYADKPAVAEQRADSAQAFQERNGLSRSGRLAADSAGVT